MTIGREQVESAQDLLFEVIPVPEWGGDARLQEFSADAKGTFGAWGKGLEDGQDVKSIVGFAARVVALSLSNDDGTLVYSDFDEILATEEDGVFVTIHHSGFEEGVAALLKRNPIVLDRLSDVVLKLSGIAPDAVEKTADELPNAPSS